MKILKILPFILVFLHITVINKIDGISEAVKNVILGVFIVISVLSLLYKTKQQDNTKQDNTNKILISFLFVTVTFAIYYLYKK